jgi:hypothetical protein
MQKVTTKLEQSRLATHSRDYCNDNAHMVFPVFTSHCLVAVSNDGRSPASGFPKYPPPQQPAPHFSELHLSSDSTTTQIKFMLRLTVSPPVSVCVKPPSGAQDQIFVTVRQLRVCRCLSFSLTRGRVSSLQFLLGLASAIILRSESHGTHDQI